MGAEITDIAAVGGVIADLRKAKGLTQNELGERLGVSFQAVSKWERAETLPDTAILLNLADVLGTTVDFILSGGRKVLDYKGKAAVADLREGLLCLKRMRELLGKDHLIYRSAVWGVNEKMNTDIEAGFTDDYIFEAFLAEAVIQKLMAGVYVDITDIRNSFRHDHFREIVREYAAKYGIR